jgi:superfamily II DNA helicase RecQ
VGVDAALMQNAYSRHAGKAWRDGRHASCAVLMSEDAISEKLGTDCKGFFHYFCHSWHSEVTEKVKIFG